MRTSPRLVASALVLALAAACSPTMAASVAATIDGHEISRATLEEAVSTLVGDVTAMDTERRAAVVDDAQREVLTLYVIERVYVRAVRDLGLEVTDEDLAATRETVMERLGGADQLDAELERARLTHDLFDVIVRYEAHDGALREHLLEGREQLARDSRHILLDTEDEAQEVIAELDDGADFGELAEERSTDVASGRDGGDLGSQPRGRFVQEFDDAVWDAQLNEILGPVQTQFGFHVIEVTGETTVAGSELNPQEAGELIASDYDEIIVRAASEAEIEIAENIGVWDPDALAVVAVDDEVGRAPEPSSAPVPPDAALLPDGGEVG